MKNKHLEAFLSLSDHLTNNDTDYYKIPDSKLEDLLRIYNKDRMILLSWDDKHNKFDINCINTDVDEKVIERILKINKIQKK